MRLWQWLWGRWSREDSGPPPRLIDIPGQVREPSADLLRRLRDIDPRAEVLYVGEGRWWVGRVKPAPERRARGRRMILRARDEDWFGVEPHEYWVTLRQGLLMAQGFGLVVDMTIQGEPDARLVQEFELAMWVERGGQFKDTDDVLAEAARQARLKDEADADRQRYRWLYRRSAKGKGNPWIGYGGGRPIATQRIHEESFA